jgi:hypothetical protein
VTTLLTATRTLAEVAATTGSVIATVTVPGDPPLEAVVLGRLTASTIEVYADGRIRAVPGARPVTDITDPERRLGLLGAALLTLDQERRQLAAQLADERSRHTAVLDNIRAYAIERHREDAFCRDGLNTFLRYFGLPEYQPYVRVAFTIHGSYRVDDSNADTAEDDAATNLGIDLSGVHYVISGSADYQVEIDEVETLDQ